MNCDYLMQIKVYPNREIRLSLSRGNRPSKKKKGKAELFPFEMPTRAGDAIAPLDILSGLSQASQSKPRGRFPLSPEGQRNILRLAAVMREEDKGRQVFVTGTLPGSTFGAMREFSRLSGYVIKLIQTYVPRMLGVGARELQSVYVWEQQKRGALHAHVVFECPTESVANRLVVLWRWVWVKVLRAAQKKASVDLFERAKGGTWEGEYHKFVTDAKLVRKSVDRYLSKYVSKGDSNYRSLFPARWYGASSAIRDRLREFVSGNSFHLPFSIEAWVELEDVKQGILRAFARFSPKGGKDVSQWFQDWSVQVFGFMSEGWSSMDCLDAIFEEIRGYVKGKEGKAVDWNRLEVGDAVYDAVVAIAGKVPNWAQLQLGDEFARALGVRMTPRSVATREGVAHYGAILQHLCSVNDSESVPSHRWPKSALRLWVSLEKTLEGRMCDLPRLQGIERTRSR